MPIRVANRDLLPDVRDEDCLVSDKGDQRITSPQTQRTSAFQSFLLNAHYGPKYGVCNVFEIQEGINQLRHIIVRHGIRLVDCPRAVAFLESTQLCSLRLGRDLNAVRIAYSLDGVVWYHGQISRLVVGNQWCVGYEH